MEKMPRVWLLLKKLDKDHEARPRRLGTTPAMLKWTREAVQPVALSKMAGAAGTAEVDDMFNRVVIFAAVLTAFSFLLRAGEYCNSGGVDLERFIRGKDVAVKNDGFPVKPGEAADEIDLQFRKAKTDQEAFGATRSQFKFDGVASGLCVMTAHEMLKSWAPERYCHGRESQLPLFRWGMEGWYGRQEGADSVVVEASCRGRGLAKRTFHVAQPAHWRSLRALSCNGRN